MEPPEGLSLLKLHPVSLVTFWGKLFFRTIQSVKVWILLFCTDDTGSRIRLHSVRVWMKLQ